MRLPLNCTAEYIPDFLSNEEAAELYRVLIEDYQLDRSRLTLEVVGELVETDNFKILFATEELIEQGQFPENVFGKRFAWSGLMAETRGRVERLTGTRFDIGMCLYYPDGSHGAIYHSDQETSGAATILPSLSLGQAREFRFREKSGDHNYSLELANGSLLVMGEHCQSRYEHSLPEDPRYGSGRINITFREASFK
jgi:hypothetical protein